MAPIFYKYLSILAAFILLFEEFTMAKKPCNASCSAETTVRLGSGYLVYCTFFPSCADKDKQIFADNMEQRDRKKHNSTTISLNVSNITKDTTYSCKCGRNVEPCGIDISTGYPPDVPQNLTCSQNGEQGAVVCTWRRGRETHIGTTSELSVSTNSTNKPVIYEASTSVPGVVSAQFHVNGSVQHVFSVWVLAYNKLGSEKSPALNFTLSDIVRPFPPELARIECSSRGCRVTVAGHQGFQLLEVQYRTHHGPWITYNLTMYPALSIFSLEPFRQYEFRVRTRFSRGLWSLWSRPVSNWTQEEAPVKALDLWYTRPSSTSAADSSVTVHWKELNGSEARGRILGYDVVVHNRTKNLTSTDHHTVLSCASCEVTVYARNSKGRSPPASVTISLGKAKPPQTVTCEPLSNHSFAISWRSPVSAEAVTGYLVEWYPVGRQVEKLSWVRLGPEELHTIITDNIDPYECYEGAVSALYEGAAGRVEFVGVSTLEIAPTEGPSVDPPVVDGDKVTVTWKEVPAGHGGGCVISYSIYVENVPPHRQTARAKRAYTLEGLPPAGTYHIWVTAWTASGEGPISNKVQVPDSNKAGEGSTVPTVNLIIILAVAVATVSLCLWQIPALRRRVFMLFHCLMLDIVPDPANSKWAKECAKEGEMKLYLSNSSMSEEEEPPTVEVQELPEETWSPGNTARRSGAAGPAGGATDISDHHSHSHSLSPVTDGTSLLYPQPIQSSYLKSFSQESDSSEQTQSSRDTEVTVDYISTHVLGMGEEEEEEEDEEGLDVLGFFPCAQNILMDPLLSFGGKLTLDAVRIDCSEFLN